MADLLPIYLFTDFGWAGPYVGQMHVALMHGDASSNVFDLMHDAPAMRPDLAAYLLSAVCATLPRGVVLGVVDPGVGGERAGLIVESDRLLFVGPDNGLFSRVGNIRSVRTIDWQPPAVSKSFHGRDIFAPIAARLARREETGGAPLEPAAMMGANWAPDCTRVVYIDGYGNAMTGIRGDRIWPGQTLDVAGRKVHHAATFCRGTPGEAFWYRNSQGLIEIAVPGCSAADTLGLALGDEILLD